MTILYLHGVGGGPRGAIGQCLVDGFRDVVAPEMPALRRRRAMSLALPGVYRETVRRCQAEFDRVRPTVLVATSFGARLALELMPHEVPRVLIAPALGPLPMMGVAMGLSILDRPRASSRVLPRFLGMRGGSTIVLHCVEDPLLSIEASRRWASATGATLREVGYDGRAHGKRTHNRAKHAFAFDAGLEAVVGAVEALLRPARVT